MQAEQTPQNGIRRAVNDLVMAEMFLVQATIESAIAIGDGISELGRQIADTSDNRFERPRAISRVVQRTADEALEPFTIRMDYLRELFNR